ncbi:MAG: hypothetical protein PHT00_00635 [Candidatus Methanomethylophilus sp.]|nr:hypothetical protein [Methanomethylophilus sp.]MDD3232665.1 hypothetical protein [Methanomethylophilus sp.]MDD4222072.1 hypothetical protein [Methanomethylophilus sp.]MDD4668961.1 hypothetical protein [Methanomethylophilus sp.]
MKVSSVHFILKGKSDYKDLAPVFPDILKTALTMVDQLPEEEEILEMLIQLNVEDLAQNRKPEGYVRKGRIRIVFPLDRKEFYLKSYSKTVDLGKIGDTVAKFLDDAGIKYSLAENDNSDFN